MFTELINFFMKQNEEKKKELDSHALFPQFDFTYESIYTPLIFSQNDSENNLLKLSS